MVSFKGKSSIKQYTRGKPNPWGFKLWWRAGKSGILYDFDVYQRASKNKPTELGVGGDIVIKLTESLQEGKYYEIFADNYFTSGRELIHVQYVSYSNKEAGWLTGCMLSPCDLTHWIIWTHCYWV
jgi:hypothetical protein